MTMVQSGAVRRNLVEGVSKWTQLLVDAQLARAREVGTTDELEWHRVNEDVAAIEFIVEHQHILLTQGIELGHEYMEALQ